VATAGRRGRGTTTGTQAEEDGADDEHDRDAARAVARERLRRALAAGDYDGLLDPALWRLLDIAAASTGFGREIGALRFAMARLLAEEEDPRQLATHLARVATTIVRATQAQRRPDRDGDDPVRAALLAGLSELDGDDDGGELGDDQEPGTDGEEDGWRA